MVWGEYELGAKLLGCPLFRISQLAGGIRFPFVISSFEITGKE